MKNTDWESIEADYRAGLLSIREIAAKNGVSDTAIRKKAKREYWTRDLEAKIQHKANELVRIKEVRAEVRAANQNKEKAIINSNAEAIAQIRLAHRTDINRARDLVNALFEEIQNDPDIKTSQKVTATKQLTDALKNVVGLEREAWGISITNEELANKPTVINLVASYE